MVRVIVERVFAEPVTEALLKTMGEKGRPCFDVRHIRKISTLLSMDGRRVICEYEAPDAESVRSANDKAGFAYERVWTAHRYDE